MKTARLFPLFFVAASLITQGFADNKFKVLKKISVVGDSSWDGLTIDPETRRLYVAHGTRVNVLDIDTFTAKIIPDTPGVRGIAVAVPFGRGFISQSKTDSVVIFDLKTLKKLGEVPTGKNPDGIVFDPATSQVFVFNDQSRNSTVINREGDVVATIPLSGKPESAIAEGSGLIYVNIEDKNSLVTINARNLKVETIWPLPGCEGPAGLAWDATHHLLFVGCRNKTLTVVNANDGKVVTTVPIGDQVDTTVFDPETELLFAANGDGTLTVIHKDSPTKFRIVENVPTQLGARTMALDPKTHRLFLAAAQITPRPTEPGQPSPRPKIAPGTFNVLVVGQ